GLGEAVPSSGEGVQVDRPRQLQTQIVKQPVDLGRGDVFGQVPELWRAVPHRQRDGVHSRSEEPFIELVSIRPRSRQTPVLNEDTSETELPPGKGEIRPKSPLFQRFCPL